MFERVHGRDADRGVVRDGKVPRPHDDSFGRERDGDPEREPAVVRAHDPARPSQHAPPVPVGQRPQQRRDRHPEREQRPGDRQQQDVLNHVGRQRRVGGGRAARPSATAIVTSPAKNSVAVAWSDHRPRRGANAPGRGVRMPAATTTSSATSEHGPGGEHGLSHGE